MRIPLLRRTSIKSKLAFIILFFVCTPLIVFGYFWYEKTTTSIETNAIAYSQLLLKQTNQYLDFYLADLEQATAPIQSNPLVQRYMSLEPQPTEKYKQFQLSKQIQEEEFSNILNGRSDIFGISLINKNAMQVNNYSKVNKFLDMNQVRQRTNELWREVDQLDTYKVMGVEFVQNTPVLTVVRKLYDNTTYETSGLLVIHLQLNQIAKIMNDITLSHFKDVWIVDKENKIIYHPEDSRLGTTYTSDVFLNNQEEPFYIDKEESQSMLMVQHTLPNEEMNWRIIAGVPMSSIMENLIHLRNSTIWIGLILIGAALFFVGGFSYSLTYSLENLQKLMKRAEKGNLNIERKKPFPLYQNDEVSDLYDSFYSMTHKLDHLIEEVHLSKLKEKEMELKTRESELLAMQSQINPHFLYNTLEIINSHAIIENQMMISNMTTSLADMFRYNVSNTKKVVPLQEEIAHIKAYLAIQKERFEELQVILDIPESDSKDVWTARITLQPILENAFVHGYEEHSLSPQFIGIYGKKTKHYYQIYVVDRGMGMDPDVKEEFNYAFMHNVDVKSTSKSTRRIGLLNVHKRLNAHFGSPYGLNIYQSSDLGTVIQISLPYHVEEQKKEA